ncbi:hypothetical protein F4806DRAFT_499530 [Annulohypoxylon nitens]|nr:hypothetical protein F4806DRAFT_499530 [Annulohypoxylon nitens]
MTSKSENSAYGGATPSKPTHRFSENPPTSHPVDDQSLRDYRLDNFVKGPNSVPLQSLQASATSGTQAQNEMKASEEVGPTSSHPG